MIRYSDRVEKTGNEPAERAGSQGRAECQGLGRKNFLTRGDPALYNGTASEGKAHHHGRPASLGVPESVVKGRRRARGLATHNGPYAHDPVPKWTQCYPGDFTVVEFHMGVAVDFGYLKRIAKVGAIYYF